MKTATLALDFNDKNHVLQIKNRIEADFPHLRISRVVVQGETVLKTENGGLRFFCIYDGQGEVFLPAGYRTQEGDGAALPAEEYRPDPVNPDFKALLERLRAGRITLLSKVKAVPLINAILGRLSPDGGHFTGDITGELWQLVEQVPRPWSEDAEVEAALDELFTCYRDHGFSTKTADSWEPLMAGDMLRACGDEELKVRGNFSCFSIENTQRSTPHVSSARRLRYLKDTAGGCNPVFDPFRRLPVTWFPNYPGEKGDGVNFFNCHIVNIPAESSPTHFHPPTVAGGAGGLPQTEFYLALDPSVYQLATDGDNPRLVIFPDLTDLACHEVHSMKPGTFVYMPPGTGHRGMNVFAMVMTIPGFKIHNELYIDRDIHERVGELAPSNPNHYASKNYESLEDVVIRGIDN